MEQSKALQSFLAVRKHRTEQARENFTAASNELKRAVEILNAIDNRIESLSGAIQATEKYYAAELLPLNQLFTVQLHLNNLHEQLIQEKRQQREAWANATGASRNRDEKMSTYLKVHNRERGLREVAQSRKSRRLQQLVDREEQLAVEQWNLAATIV